MKEIADFQLPIADFKKGDREISNKSAIGNRQLAIT